MGELQTEVTQKIPEFLNQLPVGTDSRFAVMWAHDGASTDSGSLSYVSSASESNAKIQSELQSALAQATADADPNGGNAMLYAFLKSMGSSRLASIQTQGFYRAGAALSVVFVTNGKDLCDTPAGAGSSYSKYCLSSGGALTVTAGKVLAQMTALKSAGNAVASGILSSSLSSGGVQSVVSGSSGLRIDIAASDYSTELLSLAGGAEASDSCQAQQQQQ